ncbi:uncharacterized protein C8A04DRAFT_39510 [Dichotomopilus funicola]|uniref:Nicotinamide riboside kinase 1 n=1 Tax=Dichotomopilus funicola TaxID=1934379 RepID=A0AAN6UXZ1_9PEZI|nr:hypothetical protein C8A04DRAFT_39510 [Dichotomopilus funicola]
MDPPRTVIIGISGCSSSGKTTLARLLRDIFPETFILHEDDFYKPESELPIKHGLVDWDCPEAISIPDLEAALVHIRKTGTFPPNLNSLEDLNTVGPCPATPEQIASNTARVQTWLSPGHPGSLIFNSTTSTRKTRICILDGFLLYSPPPAPSSEATPTSSKESPFRNVMSHLNIKLFLLASKTSALRRRKARDGYVHVDGFWTDPPGYVEKIVWPNYVETHGWLFEGGDVEGGRVDGEVVRREGIWVPGVNGGVVKQDGEGGGDGKEGEVAFGEVLGWAVGVVMEELERVCLGEKGE